MSNSTLNFAGKALTWSDGIAKDSKLSFSGEALITGSSFNSTTLNRDGSFGGEVIFRKCTFDAGQIIWPVTSKAPDYHFSDCKFLNQDIDLVYNGLPSWVFERCTFEHCKITNLRIDLFMFRTTVITNCRGYVIVEDRAAADKEMESIKQPGKVFFFKRDEIYYIPEAIWNGCQRDFKSFEKKIR